MIKTVKQACVFNPVIHDYKMAAGIVKLTDLNTNKIDGIKFFDRNFVTQGMQQLFHLAMLRLSGESDQAVFELSQSMGGGKTHMMVALGLLAKHPQLRSKILNADLTNRTTFNTARIATFNGHNTPKEYIWGVIAMQLGADEQIIKDSWVNGPKPIDEQTWKDIIADTPTLILLDELPPYLKTTSTEAYGKGTLADKVVSSLSALMTAALELPNCCIVITNLSGSYKDQAKALTDAINNLHQEARRQAKCITPVQLAGNEIYEILKKRLIDKLPDEQQINEIAEEYAQQIKTAEAAGYITAASIEQIAQQVTETYPFHPSFKHLVARFKENEGFRQTRGLMEFTAHLLKSVEQRQDDDVFLIGTQHLNLNDTQVKDQIIKIAPNLLPAITRDIADNGNAIAEGIDADQNSDAATQLMTLLMSSSLSRAVGGRIGLSEHEIIEFLAAPNRKADEFKTAVDKLRELAWYLHREDERWFIKETENLSRQIERSAKDIPQPKIDNAFTNRLEGILQPQARNLYQDLQVLPKIDDLNLSGSRVLIVIKPNGKELPNELIKFFEFQQQKNNLLVLSGQDSVLADAVESRLRELYALEQISKRLKSGDTLFEEARDRLEEAEDRFAKALSAGYNTVWFPDINTTTNQPCLVKVTIDIGLEVVKAEAQLEQLLASPRANCKLVLDLEAECRQYFAMAEADLWPAGSRRTPWKDVADKAKTNAAWPWMPSANGMNNLRSEAISQGIWRSGEDGYIEKGPFPQEKTSVNISSQGITENKETILHLSPRNAGDSPVIHYAPTNNLPVSSCL